MNARSIFELKVQICQCREWLLHSRQDFLRVKTRRVVVFDLMYAIVVLDCMRVQRYTLGSVSESKLETTMGKGG